MDALHKNNVNTAPSGPPGDAPLRAGRIVVDSCCDLTHHLEKQLRATTVSLTMRLGSREVVDDAALDLDGFMDEMSACNQPMGSASPSPALWQAAFSHPGPSYAVTLSRKLSGSYASALVGKKLAAESGSEEVHVFDSRSASAGETLVALKLAQLLDRGETHGAVIRDVEEFIRGMKTYFVLERYDNLQKNGRLGRITGKLITAMNIKLVMGADGQGEIALFAKPRGGERMLDKLMELIARSGRPVRGERLVISHCRNPVLAETLRSYIGEAFPFGEILVVPTRGISSLYADRGGVVVAF